MPVPRSRVPRGGRIVGIVGVVLFVLAATGCTSSPQIANKTFAQEQRGVLKLVNATGAALGAPAEYVPAHSADKLPCYKKMLGYTVKHLAANHAEVPVVVNVAGKVSGSSLLPRIERYWTSLGLKLDRSGLSDAHEPKVRTHVGNDLLVATGFVGVGRMTLYGVSPCVKS